VNADLAKIGADWWEWTLRSAPTYATYLGDHRFDDRLPEIDAAARASDVREANALLARLKKLDPAALDESDRVSWDIVRLQLEWSIEESDHKFYQWAVDQMMGPQLLLLELLNYHPLDGEKGQRDLVARWRAFPRYVDQYVANLQEGVAERRVAPRIAVARVLAQIEGIVAQPPLTAAVAKAGDATLRADLQKALDADVLPAYRRLADFLRGYPSRDTVGLGALPGGRDAYEYRVRMHTTTGFKAGELHRIGHEELKAIQSEMRAIARGNEKAFLAAQMKEPRNFHARREDLLASFTGALATIEKKLPQFFDRLPQQKCVVKPIEDYREKDAPAAYYYPPPEDRSRPGTFYANLFKPETRPRFNELALTVHEAVPGHHLQIAIAQETALPIWRRHAQFTAFVEGWALYSERLAVEMGVYPTDLDLFGMLTYQAWRACRLVVDTGLHAMDWSREQAVEFFTTNVALGGPETGNEVDRYIIWPGQALAYKVGQREIEALRHEAERAMGPRFKVGAFHDVVLRNGALPLSTLRDVVRAWMAT